MATNKQIIEFQGKGIAKLKTQYAELEKRNLSLETEKGIPFVSYSTPPITPSQFDQPQVILNSDRIIIEAETDSMYDGDYNAV